MGNHKLNKDYGLRFGIATGYEGKEKNIGGLVPLFQIAYHQDNYILGFGFVSTINFKINI